MITPDVIASRRTERAPLPSSWVSARLLADVALASGVSIDEITGHSRLRHIRAARQAWLWLLWQVTGATHREIALVADRDRKTVGEQLRTAIAWDDSRRVIVAVCNQLLPALAEVAHAA